MGTTQQVVLRLDKEEYGIDIMRVYGIEKYQEVVHIPNTPPFIEGIINLRGDVLPIFNIRKKFHLTDRGIDEDTKIIVTNANNRQVGFIVDSVAEILHIDEENIEKAPEIIAGINRKYIKSVAKLEGRMIILLDVDMILTEEEQKSIEEVAEQK